jgi:hypothetical protein
MAPFRTRNGAAGFRTFAKYTAEIFDRRITVF